MEPRHEYSRWYSQWIDPFLENLGWDVRNVQGRGEHNRDVIHEDAIRVGGMVGLRRQQFSI